MSYLIYIMGKSASGKDTVYRKLKEKINTNEYVLYTTRPKREGEHDGREYNFITNEEFNEFEKQDKVIEARHYNVVNAKGENDIWIYATIDDDQWNKEGDFLTIGTLESYGSIKNYLSEHLEKDLKLLPVYIFIDEEERRKRAFNRESNSSNPNFKEMERRLQADNNDFSNYNLMKAGIVTKNAFNNTDLEKCVSEIKDYIENNTIEDYKIIKLDPMMPRNYSKKERERIKEKEKEIFKNTNNVKKIDDDEGR